MKRSNGVFVFALLALSAAMAGCYQQNLGPAEQYPTTPANSISVYQLAGRINCQVTKSTGACATLQSRRNTVTVFSDPGGAVYVNGQPVARHGQIAGVSGTIFVDDGMAESIRPLLRQEETTAGVYTPRPAPPARVVAEPTPSSPRYTHVNAVVVLDPGHGGKDSGCLSRSGVREKDIVLPIALEVRRQLTEHGVRVVMTRSSDEFIELDRRAETANQAGADLFVAIHADSAPNNAAATGHTVYVSPGANGSVMSMAQAVDRDMENRGMASRGIRHARYRVLVNTSCPAMLVEVGYLSNRGEANQLCSPGYRNQVATAITEGILDALRVR